MTATIDDIANTLGEFEALAQGTGEWDGADPVEFSADGVTWLPVWVKTDDHELPPFARATVRRKGVAAPTVMIVAWAESVPAADDWRELWERKPMKLFGSFALRSAIRHAFRDVVGERRGPDEQLDGPRVDDAAAAIERDWDAEIANATSVRELEALWGLARAARARTGAREVAYKKRLHVLEMQERDDAWDPVEMAGRHADHAEALAREHATPSTAEKGHPDNAPRRAPQDHLPGNRATRRAAAKRKGRRS